MEDYRVLESFTSPLLGNKEKGDVFSYGKDAAKSLIENGFIEKVKKETKPHQTKAKKSK